MHKSGGTGKHALSYLEIFFKIPHFHQRTHAPAPSNASACQQATQCSGRCISNGGNAAWHCSVAKSQRAANVHPGGSPASEGTMPRISVSRGRLVFASAALS